MNDALNVGRIVRELRTLTLPEQVTLCNHRLNKAQRQSVISSGHSNVLFHPNRPVGKNTLGTFLSVLACAAGITDCKDKTPHTLRQWCITTLANDPKINPVEVAKLARHRNVSSENACIHADEHSQAAAFQALTGGSFRMDGSNDNEDPQAQIALRNCQQQLALQKQQQQLALEQQQQQLALEKQLLVQRLAAAQSLSLAPGLSALSGLPAGLLSDFSAGAPHFNGLNNGFGLNAIRMSGLGQGSEQSHGLSTLDLLRMQSRDQASQANDPRTLLHANGPRVQANDPRIQANDPSIQANTNLGFQSEAP